MTQTKYTEFMSRKFSVSLKGKNISRMKYLLAFVNAMENKNYCEQFGNKSSFAFTRKTGIIVGPMAIEGNMFDGHSLLPQLEQVREFTSGKIRKAIVDRGYRGK